MKLFSKLNPFKRKHVDFISNTDVVNNLTPHKYLLNAFGIYSVKWDQYFYKRQNDDLLIKNYNEFAEIQAPIQKYSQPAKQVSIDIYQQKGNDRVLVNEKHFLYKPIQDFWTKYADLLTIQKLLLGNVYISALEYATVATEFVPKPQEFILLPSQNVEIKIISEDFRNVKIQSYDIVLKSIGKAIPFKPENTLHIKSASPIFDEVGNYLYGISPLVSCGKNIQSLEANYGAKVGLYKNGARGIITGKQLGEFAAANVQTNEDVQDLQNRFNQKYGMQENQHSWLITDIPLDVTVISMNVQQLQLNEMNQADSEKICSVLNVDPLVVASNISSTFSNKEIAEKNFYTQSFKRFFDEIISQFSEYIKRFDPTLECEPNYTKIPLIVEALKSGDKELLELTKLGLYTRNEYFTMIGERTVDLPEYDMYYVYSNSNWLPLQQNTNQDGQGNNNE